MVVLNPKAAIFLVAKSIYSTTKKMKRILQK